MVIQSQTHNTNWLSLLESLIPARKSVQQWTSLQTHFFCLLSFLVKWCPSYPVTQAASLSHDFSPSSIAHLPPLPTQLGQKCCSSMSIYYFHNCYFFPILSATMVFRPFLLLTCMFMITC